MRRLREGAGGGAPRPRPPRLFAAARPFGWLPDLPPDFAPPERAGLALPLALLPPLPLADPLDRPLAAPRPLPEPPRPAPPELVPPDLAPPDFAPPVDRVPPEPRRAPPPLPPPGAGVGSITSGGSSL
jgi:hypothetical protein